MRYKNILTHDFLLEEYISKNKSSHYIAKELKCNKTTVLRYLKLYNIERRNVKELNKIRAIYTKGINSPSYKDGRTNKIYYCIDCGKKISMNSGCYGKGRCNSCRAKDRIEEKSANWIGGKSFEVYPKEFNNELKEEIRKRDNYTCRHCGITEEEHIIVFGKILTVHHIDYNKQNCNEDNLITLCGSDNTRANYNRDYWEQYYAKKNSHGVFFLA